MLRLNDLADDMSKDSLLALTGPAEHERLDFKSQLNKSDAKHVAAMAMTDGGWLVAGVDDPDRGHRLTDWPLTQDRRDLIMGTLSGHIGVPVATRAITVDGKAVVVVAIPAVSDRIVTTSDGRIMRRRGTESVPLLGDEVARFVLERSTRPATDDELTFDEGSIEWARVDDVLTSDGRSLTTPDTRFQCLVDLGLALDLPDHPQERVMTVAALILFGRDPRSEVSGAEVRFVRRDGRDGVDTPVTRRDTFHGPLITVLEATVRAILDEVGGAEMVTGIRRERVSLLPDAAVREAVANALGHRDYGLRNATIDVTVTDDGVTVRSPGSLPGHVTVDNIRDEHYSRNRSIMSVLRRARLVEEFGDGVDRIFDDMAERLLPEPEYAATQSSVTVTLRTSSSLSLEDQVWLDTLSDITLDRDDRHVLLHTRHHGSIARRDAAELPLAGEPAGVLSSMVSRRLLEPRGRRGGRVYVLSSEVTARVGDTSIARERRRRDLIVQELVRREIEGLSTRAAARLLGDQDLRPARQILNDLVRAGEATADGNTAARRYFMT